MPDLQTNVRYIKGIGEKKAQALEKLGVFSLFDLISFFPRRYEDRTRFSRVCDVADGESVCLQVVVVDEPRLARVRKGMELVKFRVADPTGMVDITYFNQTYVRNNICRGDGLRLFGRAEVHGNLRSMVNPVYEKGDYEAELPASPAGALSVTGRIVPVYRVTAGLSTRTVMQAVRSGLDACVSQVPEVIPEDIRIRCSLAGAPFAYENIHFPKDETSLGLARQRLIFEEFFILACALGRMHREKDRAAGPVMMDTDLSAFLSSLSFTPTGAQMRAIRDGLQDMTSGTAMSRLVQGDVGSGKTLVAAALIACVCRNGYTAAFMAPTEILAEQHFATLTGMLGSIGLRVLRLTGGLTAKERRMTRDALKNGEYDLVIGTHALLSEDVELPRLALVITDEQHRFGVKQRAILAGKGHSPHVCVMSATPIPRTLALILYGDLDVSIIDELPPGRQKVSTFAVDESYRQRLNGFVRKLVQEGRQVFVVCPMVEENEELPGNLKSAQEHSASLAEEFPDLRVACIHGKMKVKEKDAVMSAFAAGDSDILVSTTVIEVGVDVPNAALMIIENAERFGLSQLHQLRGRVGRGKHKSWCILVSDNTSDEVKARLGIMTKTNDGFRISEEDLRLRGPGDFFGSRQHGLPEMHVADLGADMQVLQRAQQEANLLLAADPCLALPEHRALADRVDLLFRNHQGTLS